MAEMELDELRLILRKLHEHIPNFSVTEIDFRRPSSRFVINLYANLINRINENIATLSGIENRTRFITMINIGDEESSIFNIYSYICSIYRQFDIIDFFNLTDLYCPNAKRTKCACKTLLMYLENLIETSEIISKIQNTVSSRAENEKVHYDEKRRLEEKLSEKAKSVGTLKNETETLTIKYQQLLQCQFNFETESEEQSKILKHEQTILDQKYEQLQKDEEEIKIMEKQEQNLQEEVLNSEGIELAEATVIEIENQISLLEEEMKGFEENLQNKKSELYAYEELLIKLNKIQHAEVVSELEQIHKVSLNIKDTEDHISSGYKALSELKALKIKQIEKDKNQKKQIKDSAKAFIKLKEELASKNVALEDRKVHKKRSYSRLCDKEKVIMENLCKIQNDIEKIDKDYKDTRQTFQNAVDEIMVSAKNTTERIKSVLNCIGNEVHKVWNKN